MNFIKRAAIAASLAASVGASALADDTRTIQYHPGASPTIYCAAGLECEIRLASGERITRAENPQAQLWGPDAGLTNGRVVLFFKPEAPNLRANFIALTDRREYRMWLVSYDGTKEKLRPLYTEFAYNDEARLAARKRARELAMAPKPIRTPAPLTVAQQMDRACNSMSANEQYVAIRERRRKNDDDLRMMPEALVSRGGRAVCNDRNQHTFFQMPLGGVQPSNVPSLVEIDSAGRTTLVVAPYDPVSRIFRADDVSSEYALVYDGVRLRIERQIAGKAAP